MITTVCAVQMSMKEGNIMNALPEYVLRFHPPLVIHNVLPYEIVITLADAASQGEQPRIPIAVGASVEVYHFSMNRKIRMAVQMQVGPHLEMLQSLLSDRLVYCCSKSRSNGEHDLPFSWVLICALHY